MTARPATIALLAATALASLAAPGAPAPPGCAPTTDVAGQGPSCPAPGGWTLRLPDGFAIETHGGDPIGALPSGAGAPPPTAAGAPVCVADAAAEHHIAYVYAHPADRPSRAANLTPLLQAMFLHADAKVAAEAAPFGASVHLRTACTAEGLPRLLDVELPTPSDADTYFTIVGDLRALGFTSARAKYWIWYDGFTPCQCYGFSGADRDDRLALDNANNVGPDYAVVFGVLPVATQLPILGTLGATVLLHEGAHGMGAVQLSAPHSTGALHCNDGADVLCYADGGPRSRYEPLACPGAERFDCHNDDYFHPAPPPGNYLAGHWNLGSPLNRFLAFGP